MDWILGWSLAVKLVCGFVAVELLLVLMRRLDRRLGLDWKTAVLPALLQAPVALAIYFGARIMAMAHLIGSVIAGALVLILLAAPAAAGPTIPSTYDKSIKAASALYLPGLPWKVWKAQLYQESRLNPDARSPVGAEGLAQFMPATWAEVTKAMKLGTVDRRMAEPSIAAGAYYMMTLRKRWSDLSDLERHRFAAGGYNAGNGSIGRARRACDGSPSWELVAVCLEQVTGKHAAETQGYVRMIFGKWWPMLEAKA